MKGMKRVWLAMALGWGGLLLWAGVAFGVVLLRAQGRAEARWTEALQDAQHQEEALRQLDTRFAFDLPTAGPQPLPDARRLRAYLAAREDALAAFARQAPPPAEAEADEEDSDAADALARAGRQAQLKARVHEALVRSLRKHGMSPREFNAITRSLYASADGAGAARQEKAVAQGLASLERAIEELEDKVEDDEVPARVRKVLEVQVRAMKAQRERLEAQQEAQQEAQAEREAQPQAPALAALPADLGVRVAKATNAAFDVFLLTGGATPAARPLPPEGALPPLPPPPPLPTQQ